MPSETQGYCVLQKNYHLLVQAIVPEPVGSWTTSVRELGHGHGRRGTAIEAYKAPQMSGQILSIIVHLSLVLE